METITTSAADECGAESDVRFEPGTLTVATGEPAFPTYVIDGSPMSSPTLGRRHRFG